MFERYTEKARRVIFFARYEASQYGSPYIETEHLLLGFLRENMGIVKRFPGDAFTEAEIRAEVDPHITVSERISTSVEVPLTTECKKILYLAAEEADRLAQRSIDAEHLLLAMLRMEGSLAARILQARGLRPAEMRGQIAKGSSPLVPKKPASSPTKQASLTLDSFLAGLKWHKAEELLQFFAADAQCVDVLGRRLSREELHKEFETLFAPYAKKNATYTIEETIQDTRDVVVAVILWKNAILASMERVWMHRMSVVLVPEGDEWAIVLLQVTPVKTA